MQTLIESSKERLIAPVQNAGRNMLIILNMFYIIITILFLVSEKIATGEYVHFNFMFLIYGTAIVCNLLSLITHFRDIFKEVRAGITGGSFYPRSAYYNFLRYGSILSVLLMSFFNMLGIGNPNNDALLTDFALAHSLIIVTVMIIGRVPAAIWFIVVLGCLTYSVKNKGMDYQWHYMTPTEAQHYTTGLAKGEQWAVDRKTELNKHNLNPPKVTRYLYTWIAFTFVSFIAAYFFSGISLDLIKQIPLVAKDLDLASNQSVKMEGVIHKLNNDVESVKHTMHEFSKEFEVFLNDKNKSLHKSISQIIGLLGVIKLSGGGETAEIKQLDSLIHLLMSQVKGIDKLTSITLNRSTFVDIDFNEILKNLEKETGVVIVPNINLSKSVHCDPKILTELVKAMIVYAKTHYELTALYFSDVMTDSRYYSISLQWKKEMNYQFSASNIDPENQEGNNGALLLAYILTNKLSGTVEFRNVGKNYQELVALIPY